MKLDLTLNLNSLVINTTTDFPKLLNGMTFTTYDVDSQYQLLAENTDTFELVSNSTWVTSNASGLVDIEPFDNTAKGNFGVDVKLVGPESQRTVGNGLKISIYEPESSIANEFAEFTQESLPKIIDTGLIAESEYQFQLKNSDGLTWSALVIAQLQNYVNTQALVTDLSDNSLQGNNDSDFSSQQFYQHPEAIGYTDTGLNLIHAKEGATMHIHSYNTDTHSWGVDAVSVSANHKATGQPMSMAVGTDKTLYSVGAGTTFLGVLEINPTTLVSKHYDNIDVGTTVPLGLGGVTADDTHIYIYGNPYNTQKKLVAVNRVTQAHTTLFNFQEVTMYQRKYGVVALQGTQWYWIYNGVATPTSDLNDNPPWGFDDTDLYSESNPIDLAPRLTDIVSDGIITSSGVGGKLWYKNGGEDYISAPLNTINKYPMKLKYMKDLGNGKAFLAGDEYSGYSIMDIATESLDGSYLPTTFRTSNYDGVLVGNKFVFSGYYGCPVAIYDTTKAWDNTVADNFNPNNPTTPTNPVYIGNMKDYNLCNTAEGATLGNDGLVYFACHKSRDGQGGGIGIVDLTDNSYDGSFDAGIGEHALVSAVTAGDYIVFTSDCTGSTTEDASLLRYNTVTKSLESSLVLVTGEKHAGHKIVSMNHSEPFVIMHYKDGVNSTIAKFDVTDWSTVWGKTYPVALDPNGAERLTVGSDGFIYGQFGWEYFVRINPENGFVQTMHRADSQGQLMPYSNDVYVSEKDYIRKVSDYSIVYGELPLAPLYAIEAYMSLGNSGGTALNGDNIQGTIKRNNGEISAIVDKEGNLLSWDMQVASSAFIASTDNIGYDSGSDDGIFPDVLMKSGFAVQNWAQPEINIRNLTSGKTYEFTFTASETATTEARSIDISMNGGTAKTVSSSPSAGVANSSDAVTFEATADGTGIINFKFTAGTQTYLSGFSVKEKA